MLEKHLYICSVLYNHIPHKIMKCNSKAEQKPVRRTKFRKYMPDAMLAYQKLESMGHLKFSVCTKNYKSCSKANPLHFYQTIMNKEMPFEIPTNLATQVACLMMQFCDRATVRLIPHPSFPKSYTAMVPFSLLVYTICRLLSTDIWAIGSEIQKQIHI